MVVLDDAFVLALEEIDRHGMIDYAYPYCLKKKGMNPKRVKVGCQNLTLRFSGRSGYFLGHRHHYYLIVPQQDLHRHLLPPLPLPPLAVWLDRLLFFAVGRKPKASGSNKLIWW